MNNPSMMTGFPPRSEAQVTLGNWRKPPFNRWAFKHVREIVPSAEIANDPANVRSLTEAQLDFSSLKVNSDLGVMDLRTFLDRTETDGLVVLRDGRIVQEYYANDTQISTQHILMSVSKSILGLLAGILADRGMLQLDRPVTELIPEVKGSAYEGATLRDLLDMRVGIHFDENYLANSGAIIEYRKAQGWDPVKPGDNQSDLRSFFSSLVDSDGRHADKFHYVSPNTDLMGWVIERVTGRRYADLVSEYLWCPMGAERSAYITVDRLGAPRCAGGFCATTRDLARLGQLIAEEGKFNGKQVIPTAWLDDIRTAGNMDAWRAGDFLQYFPEMPIHYRSKWYVLHGEAPVIFGVGVFGQNLFVDPKNRIVIAKLSSQALPMDEERILLTMQGIEAIRGYLNA